MINLIQKSFLSTISVLIVIYLTDLYLADFPILQSSLIILAYFIVIYVLNTNICFLLRNELTGFKFKLVNIVLIFIIAVALFVFNANFFNLINYLFVGENVMSEGIIDVFVGKSFKYLIFTILLFPLVEEILFRKLILSALIVKYSKISSIIISALLFTTVHIFSNIGLIIPFISGIILGFIYLNSKSFILVVSTHILYNSLVAYINPLMIKSYVSIPAQNLLLFLIGVAIVSLSIIIVGCNSLKINFNKNIYKLNENGEIKK